MRTLMKAAFDETLEAASRREGTGKAATLTGTCGGRTAALPSIRVLIMKRSGFQALIDSFWCIHSSKASKVGGRPDATFLLCDCVCMPQVCLMSGPGPGSGAEDELLRICMQGHRRRDTDLLKTYSCEEPFFFMLQMQTGQS